MPTGANHVQHLHQAKIKPIVDDAIVRGVQDGPRIATLLQAMVNPDNAVRGGTRFNVAVIHAVVLHCGVLMTGDGDRQAMEQRVVRLLGTLNDKTDDEGRYIINSSAVNQLRYPNTHTAAFRRVILAMFRRMSAYDHKESVVRVMLERLIVNRPHPWGLLVTFIELLCNEQYRLWECPFAMEYSKVRETMTLLRQQYHDNRKK